MNNLTKKRKIDENNNNTTYTQEKIIKYLKKTPKNEIIQVPYLVDLPKEIWLLIIKYCPKNFVALNKRLHYLLYDKSIKYVLTLHNHSLLQYIEMFTPRLWNYVHFSYCKITYLSHFQNVSHLKFTNCRFDFKDKIIPFQITMKTETISFNMANHDEDIGGALVIIKHITKKNLKSFTFQIGKIVQSIVPISDDSDNLFSILKDTTLESLKINDSYFGDTIFLNNYIKKNKNLKKLDCNFNIETKGNDIKSIIHNTNIKTLKLISEKENSKKIPSTINDCIFLNDMNQVLLNNKTITTLHFSINCKNELYETFFNSIKKNETIKKLVLKMFNVTNESLRKSIELLICNKSIISLSLYLSFDLDSVPVLCLTPLKYIIMSLKGLKSFKLLLLNKDLASFYLFDPFSTNITITSLDISYNIIKCEPSWNTLLKSIKENKTLKFINLSHTQITLKRIKELNYAIKCNKTIEKIYLGETFCRLMYFPSIMRDSRIILENDDRYNQNYVTEKLLDKYIIII